MRMFGIAAAVVGSLFALTLLGMGLRFCGEAQDVAHEQFGPRAMLAKYEQFKNMAASLDSLRANIEGQKRKLADLESQYAGMKRSGWPREDREQWSLWRSEVTGVRSQYNRLAADYNAAMAKFNYAFANAGELPKGATNPLPREFAPYTED